MANYRTNINIKIFLDIVSHDTIDKIELTALY